MNLNPEFVGLKNQLEQKQKEIQKRREFIEQFQKLGEASGIDNSVAINRLNDEITNLEREKVELKNQIVGKLKEYVASELVLAGKLNNISPDIQKQVADLNNTIENLDLNNLQGSIKSINDTTKKISSQITNEYKKEQNSVLAKQKTNAQKVLSEYKELRERIITAQAKPQLENPISVPELSAGDKNLAIDLQNMLNSLLSNNQLESLTQKLNEIIKSTNDKLEHWEKIYNAKIKRNELLAQLETLANVLGNSFGLSDMLKELNSYSQAVSETDLEKLSDLCNKIEINFNNSKAGIRDTLLQQVKTINDNYSFGITNAKAIQAIIDNPKKDSLETIADALNTSINDLTQKGIIKTDGSLSTNLSKKNLDKLKENYEALNRANNLVNEAEKKGLNENDRRVLREDIKKLQKPIGKINRKKNWTDRIKSLKAKNGAFDAFQRSVDLKGLIKVHDSSGLGTLTNEAAVQTLKVGAENAKQARDNGMNKMQKNFEKAVYGRTVRATLKTNDVKALRELLNTRKALLAKLEKDLNVNEIKGTMAALRKTDQKLVGRKNAREIYTYGNNIFNRLFWNFDKNLKKIHLIGGTAITLPKHLVELTQNLGIDSIAGISR